MTATYLFFVCYVHSSTEIHISSLPSLEGGLDFSFNNNITWIARKTWNKYLWNYYYPFVCQQCETHSNILVDRRKYFMSPLDCDISKSNFKDNGIKEIHQTLMSLISEYSVSSHHCKDIQLCEKALSNIYIDIYSQYSAHSNVSKSHCHTRNNCINCNHMDTPMDKQTSNLKRIVSDVSEGRIQMAARRIKTLDISRGSTDDCSITTNDWIWCFKRLVHDMDKTFHAVIRILRV